MTMLKTTGKEHTGIGNTIRPQFLNYSHQRGRRIPDELHKPNLYQHHWKKCLQPKEKYNHRDKEIIGP